MRLLLSTVLLLICISSPLSAQSLDFDRDVLGAIDTVPSRVSLDAAFPDARTRLKAAAADDTRGLYARQRAITLLSMYPNADTRRFLEGLLSHADAEIRRMSVYTLGRAFGLSGDARLVRTIAEVFERDESVVSQWAVRSLRWVAHEDAHVLLRKIVGGANPRMSKLAAIALRRSASAERQR